MSKRQPKGIDKTTREWIRNAADEMAARNGCRMDLERGQFVVNWIQGYLRLYEGEYAGEMMILRDWQLDTTLRLFGWIRWSDRWNRWVRRFRRASIWVPKKNKKSPTLAAWGLYLFAGDGEPGQKVYLCAKDGSQAREIAGKHAIEMLQQSPVLMSECTVNRTLMQITHEPSRSIMRPLSSANSRTKESKEGLNGSALIDETHVVDRDFIDRISRMGISRSEPLQIEVSTAGNNPDSYGKSQHDRAVSVEKGEIIDQALCTAIYEAPQDLEDSELDRDPLRYLRMANPAMGHTVDPEEALDDYNQSKRSNSALGVFKMYRLNIWQRAANPWLRGSDWDACKAAFTEDDLAGRECFAGLDLSATQDMSALVLIFPDGEDRYLQLPYFWLPEEMARENDHLVSFMDWHHAGRLILTPEDVVDYGFIKGTIRRLATKFQIMGLAYDPMFAEQITQEIEQGVRGEDGKVVEEGTGIARYQFKQTLVQFAVPTAAYERLVISHKLLHNGHPVLSWQAGHVHVYTDANTNKRPIKPKPGDIRKIDGIAAGIMGLDLAMRAPKRKTVYRRRGILRV